MDESYPVNSLRTAFRIVNYIADVGGGRVTEISEELNLANSTVHDHLRTLEKMGYLLKSEGVYQLSFRFLEIGARHRNQLDLYETAKPEVADLALRTDKFANLIVEENGLGVLLCLITGDTPIHLKYAYEGMYSGLHITANGKAIMSFIDEDRRSEILEQRDLISITAHTITDEDVLIEEIGRIQENGYAIDKEESIAGMGGVAAPIFDRNERVIGAVGLYDSINNIDELRETGSELVREKANIISVNTNYISKRDHPPIGQQ